jgi:hypothetical protein
MDILFWYIRHGIFALVNQVIVSGYSDEPLIHQFGESEPPRKDHWVSLPP